MNEKGQRNSTPAPTAADFLPVDKESMAARGWDRPDFVYVTGDA